MFDEEARTSLAWQRSGLGFFVVGVAMVRGIGRVGVRTHPVAGFIVFSMGAVIAVASAWWARKRTPAPGQALEPVKQTDVAGLALLTTVIGIASLVVALAE
jgi:hypothetical protein